LKDVSFLLAYLDVFTSMSVSQVFLDWHAPALPAAADWLIAKHNRQNHCDLSNWHVALPSARAGRRLLEILVLKSQCHGGEGEPFLLSPPRFLTVGQLPELLLRAPQNLRVATNQEMLFARVAAMQSLEHETLRTVFSNLPGDKDFLGWCTLAEELDALEAELAGGRKKYSDVEEFCARENLHSANRWRVLSEIADKTTQILHAAGCIDSLTAREHALQDGELHNNLKIALVCTSDLNLTTRTMLQQSGSEIVALILATQEHKAGFGKFGDFVPEYWEKQNVPLGDDEIYIVSRAGEQANTVAEILQTLPDVPDEAITVGLGDEQLAAAVQRSIESVQRNARHGTGTTLAQSTPAEALHALCAFWTDARPESFGAVLRNADLGRWLQVEAVENGKCLLTEWDCYAAEHLPPRIHAQSAALPQRLGNAVNAIDALLPESHNSARPLQEWVPAIADILTSI
jgi:hypothetical protein